ncbi:hypothetical protein B0A49_12760 [Cryomyces minteri]|uniref:D-arabinono-1,4-lactone oxidase n=2 Tax=Cryomyces minteri TaxID=331657 RepID=A0A4U0WI10_9PEZI|nr:hypothetical protein B0A49_12760 [Cryomyces minteri]
MDSKLDAELSKLDPAVPFRASSTHLHHTWAKTFYSRPELYIRPHSLEEIQKLVTLARRCRRRLVMVGCGHSPSALTLTSSWMVNLDHCNRVLRVNEEKKTLVVEGGIRLRDLNLRANKMGLTMPNLGSIDEQSIVGAIATATHGSSTRHGLLSQSVRSLRIVLANGSAVRCSATQNEDLFRAALVSLGALGIIVEVEFEMIAACNIEWDQSLHSLPYILDRWDKDLWTTKEYTRVWWLPYMRRAIVWRADKTDKPLRAPVDSWYGGSVGFHTYHVLLWLSNYVPRILPAIEWFVFGMQYGFSNGATTSAVEELRTGLLMNCLYSQFVNEWALPLHKGPEAIARLSAWLNGDEAGSGIPFSSKGLYVHAPVEVRVSDTSPTSPRPFLDNTAADGPTLYLNATLYRPYNRDPPCRDRYYEAFEWLMKQLGGRPHWAKNFEFVSPAELKDMYGADLQSYLRVRADVDPEGMFVGEWHRRTILGADVPALPLEEREVRRRMMAEGGQMWDGEQRHNNNNAGNGDGHGSGAQTQEGRGRAQATADADKDKAVSPSISTSSSGESFDMLHGAEAADGSVLLSQLLESASTVDERAELREETHGSRVEGATGVHVFNKM